MNNPQKLFITPEEHARRRATEQRKGHPHGGEGNCGGKEGHGTPELNRKTSGGVQKSSVSADKRRATSYPPHGSEQSKSSVSTRDKNVSLSREQVVSAMKLSFALGEPACRRYGLGSPFARRTK